MSVDQLILEGIVTTLGPDERVNIAPMGPIVDRDISHIRLRPFKSSRTYENLAHRGTCVFHVTDDVEMIARCAVGPLDPPPLLAHMDSIDGRIITTACRWYALRVQTIDDRDERTTIDCVVMDTGRIRDFFGFNRAKHAVVEAAILATRIHLVDKRTLTRQFDDLSVLIDKTGGEQERRAFGVLRQFVAEHATPADASHV